MSKPMQDKKKTNFIIACGYCLVVFVILLNYLAKPHKRNNYREGTRAAHSNYTALDKAGGDLENQLNETKRMNQEMRELLVNIQNAKISNDSNKTALNNTDKQTRGKYQPAPVLKVESIALPKLNDSIEEKFKPNNICPFEFGRNPFMSPVALTDVSAVEETVTFPGHSVICNPKLPYVFSGCNSNLNLISNY